MSFITWTNLDGMGVAIFDAEHRVAMELANRLHDAIEKREHETCLRHVVQRLGRYAEEHFSHEEEYMRLSAYSGTHRHVEAHDRLKQQIRQFQSYVQDGNVDREALATAVMTFFRDWLLEHIRTEDQLLGEHLNAKGIR